MSTITFRESLKYGGRLFALWFAVTIVGGGLAVLGGYLAAPEVRSLIASGTSAVETATLAGGLILAVLGFSSLLVGNFALAYKFLGDSVSKGIRAASSETPDGVVDVAAEASRESSDSTPEPAPESSESTAPAPAAESTEPTDPAPAASDEEVQGPATVPASEQPTAETVRQTAAGEGGQPTPAQEETATTEPAATGQSRVTDEPVQTDADPTESTSSAPSSATDRTAIEEQPVEEEPAPEQSHTGTDPADGRERTAEEIAFGADGPDSPAEGGETEETTAVADDEWFDDESATDRGAEMSEEESAEAVDRTNVETANDSSADPLSDKFDG